MHVQTRRGSSSSRNRGCDICKLLLPRRSRAKASLPNLRRGPREVGTNLEVKTGSKLEHEFAPTICQKEVERDLERLPLKLTVEL